MHVPFVSLANEHEQLRHAFHQGLDSVLDSDALVLGRRVTDFEAAFAALCECRVAIGVGSGADALELGLRALGIGAGDEVIVPANSFFASASAVCCAGGTPVFCDVDAHGLMTREHVEAALTARTRAVMPVHLYGLCVEMDPLIELAKQRGLKLIEDSCQAHGARYKGRRAGSLGDLAAFSFYPTKNLGALGDGGAVTSRSEALGEQVRLWRNYGSVEKYVHTLAGRNSRLDTLQACFLSLKLGQLGEALAARRRIAARYLEALADVPLALPSGRANSEHVYHLFVVRAESRAVRDRLREHLAAHNITTLVHYPVPIHLQEPFASHARAPLPASERWAETILSLPLYPAMSADKVDFVAERVRAFFG